MSEQNTPVSRIRLHPVCASIWRNPTPKGFAYSVTFERTYKDQDGKWQTSTSFNASELLLLAKAADKAESEIRMLRVADRTSDQFESEAA